MVGTIVQVLEMVARCTLFPEQISSHEEERFMNTPIMFDLTVYALA